jgi:hypothetical protein
MDAVVKVAGAIAAKAKELFPAILRERGDLSTLLRRTSLMCRFLGRLHDASIHARRREASEKRQGTKSRLVGAGGAAGAMGI